MRKQDDLMHRLDHLPTDDEPLTNGELERLTQTVLERTGQKKSQNRRKKARHGWHVWSRVMVSGAACAVLLVGLNGINPALAEGLPLLGNVFAYINSLSKTPLRSEQLAEYAQPAQLQAESSPEAAEVQQQDASVQPYTLTLSQIYCDELYLRVGLVLTAEDDSLADFESITIDPPMLYEDTTEAEANTLYGGITLNGTPVSGDLLPCFRKQDDRTFLCEMDYSLANYTGDTQNMQASLTLSNLVGVNTGDGAVGSEQITPLDGVYALNFTVSADTSLTRQGTFSEETQNGITLKRVAVTPGETCVTYSFDSSVPEAVSPALQVFAADGSQLQAANGTRSEEGDAVTLCEYFDAVPEGVTTLTVRAVDKNSEQLTKLAEWTVTLP